MAAVGILAALHERERSGEGQLVDISMTDGSLSWLAMVVARYFCEQRPPARGEIELAGGILCYFPYETKDGGWVSLGALEPKFWQNWCAGVERAGPGGEAVRAPGSEAGAEVAAVFKQRTRDEWTAFAGDTTAASSRCSSSTRRSSPSWCGPANGRGAGPAGHRARKQVGFPIKLSRTPAAVERAAPALGEHTDEVLRAIGFDDERIAGLREEGAV